MSHNAEDLLRAHFPQYRREAEERDRLAEQAQRHRQLLAADGRFQLGLGTTVQGPDITVRSPCNTVRTPEIEPCEGVPLHGIIPSEIRVNTKKLDQRPPVSRDFLHLASPGFTPTVRLLDKEDIDNSCTVQNERSLVHDTASADEGNLLSATSFEDNSAARSPARHAAKETSSPRQLGEGDEITASTPGPASAQAASTGTTYLSPLEFAEAARIERIRCQLYDNSKLGKKSKQRSRFIVKVTVSYKGGRSSIWFLRLLSEQRYFWRKTKKAGMSEVDAEIVANHDTLKSWVAGSDGKMAIPPLIGRIFENHEPIEDCGGLLAQPEGENALVWLNLKGTVFCIAVDQASKGTKTLAADCGIGYWHPRHER
jgi:hypothetical protein